MSRLIYCIAEYPYAERRYAECHGACVLAAKRLPVGVYKKYIF
jgi:hypothetical protein